MNELLVLLLPLAAFSGWWLARSDKKTSNNQKEDAYFKGLSYLLENETDKAIDIFFRIAHLDDTTVENQVTLGNLFRHRGEIDRALHIHANLQKNTQLADSTQQKLNLALAEDYWVAGIMNFAEQHYQLVRESSHADMRNIARHKLIKLYAEQSHWAKALEVVKELDPLGKGAIQQQAAHFHCELAEIALADGQEKQALAGLNRALQCDSHCIRAAMTLGQLAMSQKNYISAINHFNEIERQNPTFLPEVLQDLESCYKYLNQQHEWRQELSRLALTYHNPVLTRHLNDLIADSEGTVAARQFLRDNLEKRPNVLAVQAYLNLSDNGKDNDIHLINKSINKILSFALKYRCQECGFRGNQLNWYCPSCKKWGTSAPISNISVKETVT